MALNIPFDNSYSRLPQRFYARLDPTPVAAPQIVRVNRRLAEELGIDPDHLTSPQGVAMLAGNSVPPNATPIALAYAGHQFGHFVPQLGDGRANLLGEVIDRDGRRRDIQLKGSGPTPFSRAGDGRAALGPVLREYLISEAMAALGIPTTRALAAVTTGESVWRDAMLPGAVLTRVAASHLRVGTFQYFATRDDLEALRLLADHAIARHYPDAARTRQPYQAFLQAVVTAQAKLVASWLLVGFIHGVMNTDNCSIAGETIDYGPCAFMDAYDPAAVFSSIDHAGRYAYANQPQIALWNLTRLAETLLPLLDNDQDAAKAALAGFAPCFQAAYSSGLRRKLGLFTPHDGDEQLAQELLQLMAEAGADFTLTFRRLSDAPVLSTEAGPATDAPLQALFDDPAYQTGAAYQTWATSWRARISQEPDGPAATRAAMQAINPAFIPRNHQVEAALVAAVSHQDFAPFEALLQVVSHPFDTSPAWQPYAIPPTHEELVLQTFCGT